MLKLQRVLPETPRHHASDLFLIHDVGELALDQLGRLPRPEELRLVVEVVLAAGFLVLPAVLLGPAPRVDRRRPFAGAVVRQTASLAVGVGCSAGWLILINGSMA